MNGNRVDALRAKRGQPEPDRRKSANMPSAPACAVQRSQAAACAADPNLVHSDWSTVSGGARNEAGNAPIPADERICDGRWR